MSSSTLAKTMSITLFGKKRKCPTFHTVHREGRRWRVKRSSRYGYYMEAPQYGKSGYWPTMKSLREFCAENGWEIVSSPTTVTR